MNILIVHGSQFGTTAHLARVIGDALSPPHRVWVVPETSAREMTGADVDLLLVGAPTQFGGRRILVRRFLEGLRDHGFAHVSAAAFDTRLPGDEHDTGAAARVIGDSLRDAGCLNVVEPEGFVVAGMRGPLAEGEEERARAWAHHVLERMAVPA